MGERQVTRERLRSAVIAVRDDHRVLRPRRVQLCSLTRRAAEAVLRIERATPYVAIDTSASLYGAAAESGEGTVVDVYRAGERHILAQLGALAPKEEG